MPVEGLYTNSVVAPKPVVLPNEVAYGIYWFWFVVFDEIETLEPPLTLLPEIVTSITLVVEL